MDSVTTTMNINSDWLGTYTEVNETSQYLLPLIMSLGIVLVVVKVIMVAGGRGND